jgi:hypothetical protein
MTLLGRGHPAVVPFLQGWSGNLFSHLGRWRAGVISGKLGGAVRLTSTLLGAGEVVFEPGVRVLGAVNCRFECDLQSL